MSAFIQLKISTKGNIMKKATTTRHVYKLLILTMSMIALLTADIFAQMRGRVQINNGHVVADNGKTLRGAPFFLSIWDVPDMRDNEATYKAYFEDVVNDYHMNVVRIAPWLGDWTYMVKGEPYYENHKTDYLYMMDKVVDWAEDMGIYAVVTMCTGFGTAPEIGKSKDWWDAVAPRYKNKTHVIFEVVNEPNLNDYDTSKAYAEETMDDIYHHVRSLAPNTHLILWSPNNATKISISELQSSSTGANTIDYDNASFGFHVYEWVLGNPIEWNHAESIRQAGFPVICTEFFSFTDANYIPLDYDFMMDNIGFAEERGMSWMQWGPMFHYRNSDKPGWTHNAIKFSQTYLNELANHGISHWAKDTGGDSGFVGDKHIKSTSSGAHYLTASTADVSWSSVKGVVDKGWTSQDWELINVSGQVYQIRNVWSGYLLTAPNQSDEWIPLVQHPDSGWTSQQWYIIEQNNGKHVIKNVWNDMVLTSQNNNWWDTVQVNDNNWDTQKWYIE